MNDLLQFDQSHEFCAFFKFQGFQSTHPSFWKWPQLLGSELACVGTQSCWQSFPTAQLRLGLKEPEIGNWLLNGDGIALAQHYSSNLCSLVPVYAFYINSHWIKLHEAHRKKGLGAHDFPELHLQELIFAICIKICIFFSQFKFI